MAYSPVLRDNLIPGPIDRSLLRQQDVHISSSIWDGQERLLRSKCTKYVRGLKPHDSILKMLKVAGFGYVAQIENFYIDIGLISALVERWRPETCTFHLPDGECSVTLEDVALQLGVAIDGDPVTLSIFRDPVTGTTFRDPMTGTLVRDWPSICQELLGAVPPENSLKHQMVELSWLSTKFAKLPANASQTVVKQYTRAYIMRLIGGLLMPDKSVERVSLLYLPLLRDLSKVANYSWGSAILACLYRELCHAAHVNSVEIGGCLVLLQAWAWDRIPHIAPQVDRLTDDQVYRGLGFPLARRWSNKKTASTTGGPNHTVNYYRYSLDQLDIHQFIWTPYAPPDVRRCIPLDPGEVFYAMVPLICFDIVEWHHPDRVMRQFGLQQLIPQPPTSMDKHYFTQAATCRLYEVGMKVPEGHRTWIKLWMQRRERLIQGRPFHSYLDENSDYMKWYLHVTRRWISRDSAFAGTLVYGVRKILQYTASENPTANLGNVSHVCNDMLEVLQKYHPVLFPCIPNASAPTPKFPSPGGTGSAPQKQPLSMGFGSYSQIPNPFLFSQPSHPLGSSPYPSSSHHVPHTTNSGFSPQYSFPHPSTSQYPPNFQPSSNTGTTAIKHAHSGIAPPTVPSGVYLSTPQYPPKFQLSSHMGAIPSVYPYSGIAPSPFPSGAPPPPYPTTMPYAETEDDEESDEFDEFTESKNSSEGDDFPTLGNGVRDGGKGRAK